MPGSTAGATGRNPRAANTSPSRTGGFGRWALRRWRDKIVQRAVAEVLNAIYEEDFLGFSYGFRPGRSQHGALDALAVAIERERVNWIVDADIRGVLRQRRARVADPLHRAPCRRSSDRAADPQMAEDRDDGRREGEGKRGRDPRKGR